MPNTFTQDQLLKLAQKENEFRLQQETSGQNPREGVARAVQFKADTVNAMWQRIMARLSADGGAK